MEIVSQLDVQIKILQSLYRIERLLGGKFPDEIQKSIRPKLEIQKSNIIRKEIIKKNPLTIDQIIQKEFKKRGIT